MLRHLPAVHDSRVLVDAATRDDAAVFQLSEDRALVATVDFFTPIVDDAYAFGSIAAANSFSDVYAMGARPLFALNLVAWPRKPELLELLSDTLRGGADVAQKAGAPILGGHTIDDAEPKYGLLAMGEVRPDKIITLAGARPGDRLILTKPIGTGILSTALKRDLITEAEMSDAIDSMVALNADAMEAMLTAGDAVHACTDITGFGLIGHLHNLLDASGHAARLDASAVPLLPHARALAKAGAVPGGTTRNMEAAEAYTHWSVAADLRIVLVDAQTSGGLLIAVDADAATQLEAELRHRAVLAATIGHIVDGDRGRVEIT